MSFVKLFQSLSRAQALVSNRTHNGAVPLNLVQRRCFFDDLPLPFETMLLLPEAGFQYGVCGKNDVVFDDIFGVRIPVTTMPN